MKPSSNPTPNTSQAQKAPAELEAEIRRRAYELYEQRGRVDGFASEDWLQAEAEAVGRKKQGDSAREPQRDQYLRHKTA